MCSLYTNILSINKPKTFVELTSPSTTLLTITDGEATLFNLDDVEKRVCLFFVKLGGKL